jgi:hypothetical protein
MARLKLFRAEAEGFEVRAKRLRDSARDCLDPDVRVEDLRAERASQETMELWAVVQSYRELLEEIKRIEKDLGITS